MSKKVMIALSAVCLVLLIVLFSFEIRYPEAGSELIMNLFLK